MAQTYEEKRELLAQACQERTLADRQLFDAFEQRICAAPFPATPRTAHLWLELWPALSSDQRVDLAELPDPCLTHLETRMKKAERAKSLLPGCLRLVAHDGELFLDALRLYPHALCRTAEALGPVSEAVWSKVEKEIHQHRLWRICADLADQAVSGPGRFWRAVEALAPHRQLPQAILDFLEAKRARELAPLEEFRSSLDRYLVREKVERLRFSTYAAVRVTQSPERTTAPR